MKKEDENIDNRFGDLKKIQPFNVPEGYFETFADRLKARIEAEEHTIIRRSLFNYLKPVLSAAAGIALLIMLFSVPIKNYFIADKGYTAIYQPDQRQSSGSADSGNPIPEALISNFSDDQFISAFEEMNNLDNQTISAENLADFIAANYNDYEILINN